MKSAAVILIGLWQVVTAGLLWWSGALNDWTATPMSLNGRIEGILLHLSVVILVIGLVASVIRIARRV